ncbi:hypothetical protein [Nocardioides sp. YIM 152588]|uniref:NADase-type glycan-binding domain-containing protein n=1 Tax=Nocardioides sp. YIM 152588 TaxID=3158259 RepID=UPI0032E407CC
MTYCTTCGHQIALGQFCHQCGAPIAEPVTEPIAEPPLVAPVGGGAASTAVREPATAGLTSAAPTAPITPLPTGPLPPAARYPLYATEHASPATTEQTAERAAVPPTPTTASTPRGRRRAWWIGGVAALVVTGAGAVGAVRLVGGQEGPSPLGAAAGSVREGSEDAAGGDSPAPTEDLTPLVTTVQVPGTAPDSADARTGEPVTFGSQNLTDGDESTAWRVAGDASGSSLVIDLGREVELREVGLVNGYAKSYPGYDGYRANRRVSAVRWTFDDGSSVVQRLDEDRSMQAIGIDTVRTERVVLEILRTAAPGGRNFTAISELRLGGADG